MENRVYKFDVFIRLFCAIYVSSISSGSTLLLRLLSI